MRLRDAVTLLVAVLALPALADHPYRGGVAATAHPLASKAALEMLDHGGNAVDAAVAAAFVHGVVAPFHSGVGGGGFALIYDAAKGESRFLDFREVAPKGASHDMYVKDGKVVPKLSTDGGLAVAVPGAVAGYMELLARYGKLKPAQVLAPAIAAARDGFWVTPKFHDAAKERLECLQADPEASRVFLKAAAGGPPGLPEIGTLIRQPDLAKTLSQIAARGVKAFYEGAVAKAIVESDRARGGILTLEDMSQYKVRWREPIEGSYRGYRVLTIPPPSAGGIGILQVLGALEKARPDGFAYRDADALHIMAEAMRRAYVDRVKYLGDPAFNDIPLAKLISPEYVAGMAASIDPAKATVSTSLLAPPSPAGTDGGVPRDLTPDKHTTHLSVVDRAGNAVALTTTVNGYFGSCVVAKGAGVLLNNQMDDFTLQPFVPNLFELITGEANAIAPGKIPLSSMSPTIVFQKDRPKDVMLVVGANGGSTIPTSVIQVISSVIDNEMDIVRAVGLGRIHHQYLPDKLWVDRYGVDPATVKALEAKGHSIRRANVWSGVHAIWVDPKTQVRYGAADPRLEGSEMGQD